MPFFFSFFFNFPLFHFYHDVGGEEISLGHMYEYGQNWKAFTPHPLLLKFTDLLNTGQNLTKDNETHKRPDRTCPGVILN